MKCEVVPSEVSKIVPLSPSCYSSYLSATVENTYGTISKNGLWLYLVQDTVINIYHAESGKWCGGHCFAKSLNNPSARISAALEFNSNHVSFPCLLLAVNQDHESLLCMFDINSCTVRRSVLIPDRITSLDVVSENGGACIETHYLSRKLRFMFGVVAIGTLHGHLFFLDLCLDEDFFCDEKLPNITTVVRKKDFTSQKREAAIAKKQHIFLHFNDESTSGGSFEFKSISSTLGRYPNGEVYVTALKYVQSLATLAVGFNFGGIQLWELHNLSLQFTIADHHDQPIVSFAFQEPENDPRNFCYLWAIKGHISGEDELPISTSVSTLYSLTFYKRDYIEKFGALYTELQSCNKRFEFPLTNDSYNSLHTSTSVGTRLISCQVVNQKETHHALEAASSNESDSVSEDMSLCFLSWEVWVDSGNVPPSYHLAVFDLNQWYQAHMPGNFRCSPNELNPYLGLFSLDALGYNFLEEGVLGFHAIPQSVKKFKSLTASEEFFYPSSLEFQLLCFTENGLRKASYFGFQKHLLYRMADMGPQVLLNPKELCSLLIKSGLVPDTHGGIDRTPLTVQKEALLQLALEHNLPFFFMKCLQEWRYSDSMHEYCNSKSLLTWAWKKVIGIKNSIDKICLPMFNGSGEDVDKSSLKYLYSYKKQLNLIDRIMAGYQKYVTPRTEQGIQELECRKDAVSSISMYLQVVLWLRSSRILPENIYEQGTTKAVTYNYESLNASYKMRRFQLQKLHRMVDPGDVLLIDGIVKELGISNSWLEKNGSEMYPPPSIYAAVSCYLLDGVSIELKHSLMYYFLLDLRGTNENKVLSQGIKKFVTVFGMPKHFVKINKASWYLDQKNTMLAIQKLSHSCVKTTDILPWQHHRIIKSFLCWKAPKRALKYINHMEPPQNSMDAMKLHLSILLACGAVTQGWEYQRKKQLEGYGNELMNHFFLGCQEMHKMKDLMYLPLNSLESSSFVKFLSENKDPKAQEYLVIYHLLHCNFFEAIKVNDKLANFLVQKCLHWNGTPVEKRTMDRGFLVENLMAAVSSIEKSLVEEFKRFPFETSKKEDVLQPMSVSMKCASLTKAMTYSDIVRSIIYKDSPCTSNFDLQSMSKSRGSCFEDLPFLRPPVTSQSVSSKHSENLGSGLVAKRTFNSTSPTEFSSPAKKSRLLDTVPFMASPLARRTPKNLAGDIASLLQTPPIAMRTPNASVRNSSLKSPLVKPQSILKKKKVLPEHIKLNFLTCSTPSASEAESSDGEIAIDELKMDDFVFNKPKKDMGEDTESLSKQIRFDLPEAERSVVDLSQCPEPTDPEKSPESRYKDDISDAAELEDGLVQADIQKAPTESVCFSDIQKTAVEEDDAAMEVESSELQLSTASALAAHSVTTPIRVTEDNPYHSFEESPKHAATASDSGVLTVANTSVVFRFTASHMEADEHHPSPMFQKSTCVTPRPPLRQSFETADASKDPEIEAAPYSLTKPYFFNAPIFSSSKIETPPAYRKEESLSELSDNEKFYSPCADDSNLPSTPFMFAEPVNLFPESSTSHETDSRSQEFGSIVKESAPGKDSEGSNDTIIISNSDTSRDGMDTGDETSDNLKQAFFGDPCQEMSAKTTKPRRTFVFTKNTDSLDSTATSKSSEQMNLDSSTKTTKPRRTFVFAKNTDSSDSIATSKSSEQTNLDSDTADKTPLNAQMDQESSNDSCQTTEAPLVKPLRRTFVFAKNVPSSDTNSETAFKCPEGRVTDDKHVESVENPCDVQTNLQNELDPVKSSSFAESTRLSDLAPTSKSSHRKFVFTKNVLSAEPEKESQSQPEDSLSERKTRRSSRRTFVFTRNLVSSCTSIEEGSGYSPLNEPALEKMQSENQSNVEAVFLSKEEAETYEEFSKSLKQSSSDSGTGRKTDTKTILSSPTVESEVNPTGKDKSESKDINKTTAGEKSVTMTTLDKMVGTTPKLSKKKKTKGKSAQKIEFSFAEPHSPADSDILKALAQSPEPPLPSFMFSPPLTRGRLRKKRLDETMGSSFCSTVSEVSFTKPKTPPPIDPILEGIMLERNLETKKKPRLSGQPKSATKRGSAKKSKAKRSDVSDKSLLLSPIREAKDTPTKKSSPSSRDTSLRHSMVLRQTKSKPDSLF